jgi:hypothetical protein
MKNFGRPSSTACWSGWGSLRSSSSAFPGRGQRRVAFQGRDAFREENDEVYQNLMAALELLGSHLKLLKDPPEEIIPLARRNQELLLRPAFHSRGG